MKRTKQFFIHLWILYFVTLGVSASLVGAATQLSFPRTASAEACYSANAEIPNKVQVGKSFMVKYSVTSVKPNCVDTTKFISIVFRKASDLNNNIHIWSLDGITPPFTNVFYPVLQKNDAIVFLIIYHKKDTGSQVTDLITRVDVTASNEAPATYSDGCLQLLFHTAKGEAVSFEPLKPTPVKPVKDGGIELWPKIEANGGNSGKCSRSGNIYWRVFKGFDDGSGQKIDSKPLYPANKSIDVVEKDKFSFPKIGLDINKKGTYTYWLDYSDQDSPNGKYDNASWPHKNLTLTLKVTEDGKDPKDANPGGGSGNTPPTPPSNQNYYGYDLGLFDQKSGELDKLIDVKNVPAFLVRVAKILFLLLGGLATIVILVGSFRMVMSQGSSEGLTAAKRTVTWAIIGLVVSILSYSLVAILQSLIGV